SFHTRTTVHEHQISTPTARGWDSGRSQPHPPDLSVRLRSRLWRSGRHAELGHELDLVIQQTNLLDEAAVDLEELHVIAPDLASSRGNVAHRRLERAVVRAREHAFHDHVVALGEHALDLRASVRKRADPGPVILLDRLRPLEPDVSWSRQLAVGGGVARDRLGVVRVERLVPTLDHGPGLLLRRGRDLVQLAGRLRVTCPNLWRGAIRFSALGTHYFAAASFS